MHVTHLECSLTGEHYSADQIHNLSKANKPLCTQSWNVTGMRSTGTTPPNGSVKQSQPAFAPLDL